MPINPKVFKAYDIRGVVPGEVNPEIGYAVGAAFAAFLRERGGSQAPKIILSRDVRISSPEIAAEVKRGLMGAGAAVIDAGITTTPMHYWIVGTEHADGGIMVTASHNPKEYNGFKLTGRGGESIGIDSGLAEIRAIVEKQGTGNGEQASGTRQQETGSVVEKDYLADYVAFIGAGFTPPSLRLAIDASNGPAGRVLDSLLKSFPMLAVARINFEPDGNFPNHDPNPLDDAALLQVSSAIISEGASLGVIFDGDGDRVFFLDEAGRRIPGDATTALLANHLLRASSGEAVVYNVPSSRVVRETIESSGGRAVLCRTGHSFMKRAMREAKAIFGGEHSGHYYFRDTFFAENSMLAMLLFLDVVGRAKQSVSKVVAPFMKYARSGEINFVVAQPWTLIQHALRRAYPNAAFDETDGLTIETPEFRFNVRPSNTEPFVRLNAETVDQESLVQLIDHLSRIIKTS